jgi:hypothetical protein
VHVDGGIFKSRTDDADFAYAITADILRSYRVGPQEQPAAPSCAALPLRKTDSVGVIRGPGSPHQRASRRVTSAGGIALVPYLVDPLNASLDILHQGLPILVRHTAQVVFVDLPQEVTIGRRQFAGVVSRSGCFQA